MMVRKIVWLLIIVTLLVGLVAIPTQAATDDEIQSSIDEGVVWLVAQQWGDGSWDGASAQTGFAVVKLEDRAIELGYASPFDAAYPYHQNVIDGLNFIFRQAQPSGCGDGIVYAGGIRETYSSGIAMMAIAGSRDPDMVVSVGNPVVDGMTHLQVLQENVDYFACAQNPDGGWRYLWTNEPSDNSNTGYATLGLRYAEAFGCTIPQTLKDNLSLYIDAIQNDVDGDANDGGSQYTVGGGWENVLKTGNLLFEMAFVGDTTADQRVIDAIDYIERHWDDPNSDPGWQNPYHYQSMYCMMKGFESLGIDTIEVGGSPVDWFQAFADAIIATQQADGSWPWDRWGNNLLATEWALLTLEKVAPPPPCMPVFVDIKPFYCINVLSLKYHTCPLIVAIDGDASINVFQIDPASVTLEGVAPTGWFYQDQSNPVSCTRKFDGIMDLVLVFNASDVLAAIGPVHEWDVFTLQLTGNLLPDFGGKAICGEDTVLIKR